MLSEAEKIALATVTVFIVVSIIFFIAGFLYRHYNNVIMHCQNGKYLDETSTALPPTPAGDLPHEDSITHHTQELELKTNVAYENVPVN